MTTDIEKQFFETFGIKPKYKTCIFKYCKNKKEYDCENCNDKEWHYPEITDRNLLELICIIHQADLDLHGEEYYFESLNYKDLKEEVIAKCKRLADKNAFSEATGEHIKHQVQALFKEEND